VGQALIWFTVTDTAEPTVIVRHEKQRRRRQHPVRRHHGVGIGDDAQFVPDGLNVVPRYPIHKAERRQGGRLRASPVGVGCTARPELPPSASGVAVNVHPPCLLVNTLFPTPARCGPWKSRLHRKHDPSRATASATGRRQRISIAIDSGLALLDVPVLRATDAAP
jgi:hypothetical protein